MNVALDRRQRAALRGNALVTHADKARWFRSRMRWHALEWKTWRGVPDYCNPALERAKQLRDTALYHESQAFK